MASAGRRTHYEPPWGNASIIGVAGSSGSGKTSLAMAIVASLNLPWVVILSMVGFSHHKDGHVLQQLIPDALCRTRFTNL
jgi:uridine kinase